PCICRHGFMRRTNRARLYPTDQVPDRHLHNTPNALQTNYIQLMKPANKRIFISFLLLLAATTEAPAQAAASISGTVRDPHGNAIAGASAEIFARGGGMHRITTTNPEGLYHFDHLPESACLIQSRARGFARHVAAAG